MMHIVFYYFHITIFHKCQLSVYLTGVTIQKLKRDQEEKLNFNVDFKVLTPDKLVNKGFIRQRSQAVPNRSLFS